MIRTPTLLRLAGLGVCALALSGCISLLPKSKPVQLYRFGQTAVAEAAAVSPGPGQVGVFRTNGRFQQEAAADRLLTVTGGKVAYVAETRWAAPASVLFDQAMLAVFDADPGPARLLSRGEAASAAYILRVDVRNFETTYDQGAKAAPTVVVRLHATMTRREGRLLTAEQMFEARVRADRNRVSSIVPAYDKAVTDALTQLVAWTNAQATAPEVPQT